MASLTIVRDSGYADRLRKYHVIVDGDVVGQILNGETKEFPVSPGHHKLWLKIDCCGSKPLEFTASDGEPLKFRAKSNLRGVKLFGTLWYTLFDRNSYILLERSFE